MQVPTMVVLSLQLPSQQVHGYVICGCSLEWLGTCIINTLILENMCIYIYIHINHVYTGALVFRPNAASTSYHPPTHFLFEALKQVVLGAPGGRWSPVKTGPALGYSRMFFLRWSQCLVFINLVWFLSFSHSDSSSRMSYKLKTFGILWALSIGSFEL